MEEFEKWFMNPSKVVLSEKDFEELFDSHFENLMGFVCSYVRDEEVAKDIVHDVFLTALEE